MRTGIIITFHNNERQIDIESCIKQIKRHSKIQFCFVNNHSLDNTLEVLNEIRDNTDNCSIIDMKKYSKSVSAIKAGIRYMLSQFELKRLGYGSLDFSKKEHGKLSELLKMLTANAKEFNKNRNLMRV